MSSDNHLKYLKNLNRELVNEITHKDYLYTKTRVLLAKQQKAFKLLVDLQKEISIVKNNDELYRSVARLININLELEATFIYKPVSGSETDFEILTFDLEPNKFTKSIEEYAKLNIVDLPKYEKFFLINSKTKETNRTRFLQEKFGLESLVICPVFYNEKIELLIITGIKIYDNIGHIEIIQEDALTIEAVGIMISSYLRKTELIKLYETDKIKTEFVSNLSHEFRTPLTLVLGLLEELKNDDLPLHSEKVNLTIDVIIKNAFRIKQLIDQLLDISKLETNTERLTVKKGDLNELIGKISKSFSSLAQQQTIFFSYSFKASSKELWFDEDKIEKITTNLLSNAFKYSGKESEVDFSVEVKTMDQGPLIIIKVKDNGPGIPKEEQEKVFQRFYQVSSNSGKFMEGTGVGLYLSKKLTELHHGIIELKSKPGIGSEFIVQIPAGKNIFSEEELLLTSPQDIEFSDSIPEFDNILESNQKIVKKEDRPLVLIAEDNTELNNYIANYLSKHFLVIKAFNGKEGLERAIENIPDIIITDIMMPLMDGFEMSENLKNNDKTSHIPIIILTAKADKQSKFEGLKGGADDYIIKPFEIEELLLKVRNHIQNSNRLRNKLRQEIYTAPVEMKIASGKDKIITKTIDLMRENISDPDFYIDSLCEKLFISRTQLYRKTFALTGYNPAELFRIIRMKSAAEMFRNGIDNVAEVMYNVGYSNQSNFAKNFKDYFKMNPSEYIKKYMGTI